MTLLCALCLLEHRDDVLEGLRTLVEADDVIKALLIVGVREEVTRIRGTGFCLDHALDKTGAANVLVHLAGGGGA